VNIVKPSVFTIFISPRWPQSANFGGKCRGIPFEELSGSTKAQRNEAKEEGWKVWRIDKRELSRRNSARSHNII
jgi:hypothetical protein